MTGGRILPRNGRRRRVRRCSRRLAAAPQRARRGGARGARHAAHEAGRRGAGGPRRRDRRRPARDAAAALPRTTPRAWRRWPRCSPGAEATVRCRVESIRAAPDAPARPRASSRRACADETGSRDGGLVQPALPAARDASRVARADARRPAPGRSSIELAVREHEVLSEDGEALHTAGVVPVYDATKALSTRVLHELVERHLHRADAIADPLPAWLRLQRGMPLRRDAVAALHAPLDEKTSRELARPAAGLRGAPAAAARAGRPPPRRSTPPRRRRRSARPGRAQRGLPGRPAVRADRGPGRAPSAPSTPTCAAPARCAGCCIGDVGSGKTAVAVHALLRAIESGRAGRADGAHRGARPPARRHGALRCVEGLGIEVDARHRRRAGRGAAGARRSASRSGDAAPRRRHARPARARRRVRRACSWRWSTSSTASASSSARRWPTRRRRTRCT